MQVWSWKYTMGQLTSSYQIKPIFTNRNLAQGCLNYCNITLKTNKMAKLRHLGKYRHFYFSFKLRALLLHYNSILKPPSLINGLWTKGNILGGYLVFKNASCNTLCNYVMKQKVNKSVNTSRVKNLLYGHVHQTWL